MVDLPDGNADEYAPISKSVISVAGRTAIAASSACVNVRDQSRGAALRTLARERIG